MKTNIDKILNLQIQYTHPQFTNDFRINRLYQVDFDDDGYFILDDLDTKRYYDLEMIKTLFTPIDSSWDEILKDDIKVKEKKDMLDDIVK